MGSGPNPEAVGAVAAEHLGPILYALETCALAMDEAGRDEEVRYYRALARRLADAGGTPSEDQPLPSDPSAATE
ncbi:MAG: hypothetical protein PVH40_02075 [Gemmatimonadales bacterium]|jgi:hypothetical protein